LFQESNNEYNNGLSNLEYMYMDTVYTAVSLHICHTRNQYKTDLVLSSGVILWDIYKQQLYTKSSRFWVQIYPMG